MGKHPLKALHSDESLVHAKLESFGRESNENLVASLRPGQPGSLKTRPDGTILDGHHRIAILKGRGLDVNTLPREIIAKEPMGEE